MTRIDRVHQRRKEQRLNRNLMIIKVFILVTVVYFICQAVLTIN
ncbi:hypothetical protein [Companilactobacillus alimentarius]|nr:hypothetical protein [Companilactobacillus alimentarius]MDT6951893.1 hypothetical protein [Companilactobacillus alimentarius]